MKPQIRTHLLNFTSIGFLVLFPHLVPLPFYSYTIVCLGLIYLILKKRHCDFSFIGLKQGRISIKLISIGILSAIIWVAFNQWIYIPFIKYCFVVPDYTEYNFIRDRISNLIIVLVAACLVGGLYEEIAFRGFIQRILQSSLNNKFWISAFLTSVLFELYHYQQGIFGIISSFLGALYWSFLFNKFQRNLWMTIFSHAAYDVISLLLIYFGLFG